MYSPGLKKLGAELGLRAEKGRVYGVAEGFPVAMWDGMGTKMLQICLGTAPEGEEFEVDLIELFPRPPKEYRVVDFALMEDSPLALITFCDNPGTLKRMRAFFAEVLPAFRARGLSGHYRCPQCDEPFAGEVEIALYNGCAVPLHARCLAAFEREDEA